MISPIIYHPGKANVGADTLSRKVESMGSLAYSSRGENVSIGYSSFDQSVGYFGTQPGSCLRDFTVFIV